MRRIIWAFIMVFTVATLGACSEARYAAHVVKQIPMPGDQNNSRSQGMFKVGNAYTIKGKRYYPSETYNHTEVGIASWYGPGFHGKKTANGETFDQNELTAAHRTLQLPSIIRVTNLGNGRSIILRVNDRGPFAHDRILDVSERAASLLGFKNTGTAKIKLEVLANESHQVANLARQGHDTRGYEVVLNRTPARKPQRFQPVTKVALSDMKGINIPQKPAYGGQALKVPTPPPSAQSAARYAAAAPPPLAKPLPVEAVPLNAQPVTAPPPTPASKSYGTSHMAGSNMTNATPASTTTLANVAPKQIFVQAGSFSQESNALLLSDQLSRLGPSKVYLTRVNNRPYFRVRLGPYTDQSEAQRILTALSDSGNKNAVLVFD